MAGSLPTLSTLRQRYQYLRGETDYTTVNAVNDSHINQAIWDICNLFEFSWNRVKTTGTLSSGTFNLAADYNPIWHIPDARIVNSSIGDDYIFQEIPVEDRDQYDTNSYVHWLTFSTSSNLHVFNSNQTSGTVTYFYYFIPTALVNSTDTCIVPDPEAVALLAVSKNWVGDERNAQLSDLFEQRAMKRIQSLYDKEIAFGAHYGEQTLVARQPQLNGAGADQGLNIARP